MIALAVLVPAGYLLGAVPTGLVFGKLAGVDPRLIGSGRVGATTTYRALGFWPSVAVAAIDAGKGALMAYLGLRFAPSAVGVDAIVLATVLGQVYSIFLLAQGGRGVASTGGAALVLWPLALTVALIFGVAIWFRYRTNSVASLSAVTIPTASAQSAAIPWSTARSMTGNARSGAPITASSSIATSCKCKSAALPPDWVG